MTCFLISSSSLQSWQIELMLLLNLARCPFSLLCPGRSLNRPLVIILHLCLCQLYSPILLLNRMFGFSLSFLNSSMTLFVGSFLAAYTFFFCREFVVDSVARLVARAYFLFLSVFSLPSILTYLAG